MYETVETPIEKIANHYGTRRQTVKACEELGECISALCTSLYAHPDDVGAFEHLAEEMADARIMLDQMEFLLGLETHCAYWREFKLKRQLERIKVENEIAEASL